MLLLKRSATSPKLAARIAFTLIELLVVIAIIAILAGLTLAGVMRFLILAPKLTTQNDLQQLGVALASFKAKYNIYPPSKIRLSSNRNDYLNTSTGLPKSQLDQDSLRCLGQIWPKLDWNKPLAWAGTNSLPSGGAILDGDQCLVFFLGGIPNQPTGTPPGFSPDVANPTNSTVPAGATFTKFFDFDAGRLFARNTNPGGTSFLSYKDGYGETPYVYFSSSPQNYNPNHAFKFDTTPSSGVIVSPFMSSATAFHNAKTFQIVSAGADQVFGPGGPWTTATADAYDPTAYGSGKTNKGGRDDLTNFNDRVMGAGQ